MVNGNQPSEILMRALALAAMCGLTLIAATAAKAQSHRLVIDVKPRSWLDAGKVVPVGSMQNYMNDLAGTSDTGRFGARGSSSSLLPDRFSAGRGFTVATPNFYSPGID